MNHHTLLAGLASLFLATSCTRLTATSGLNDSVTPSPTGVSGVVMPSHPDVIAMDVHGRPGDIKLAGRWLAWSEIDPGSPAETALPFPIAVYDLENGQRMSIEAEGTLLGIDGNRLVLGRRTTKGAEDPRQRDHFDVWTRDLLTGEESLRLENVTRSPVRGLYPWTASAYPDACREIWDCGEAFYTGCGLKISVEDPVSHTPHDLGLWPRGTHLLDISNDLAVLRGGTAYCDIKSFSTAFEVIDLQSGEYRVVGSGGMSPSLGSKFVGLAGRTLAYASSQDQAVVLDLEPQEPGRIRLNAQDIRARALVSSDILLYSPITAGTRFRQFPTGLSAIDFRHGEYQVIDTDTYVRYVTGDGAHVAWITYGEQLFVATLQLQPYDRPAFLDTPMPVLNEGLSVPMSTPTWLPPTRPPWMMTPTP